MEEKSVELGQKGRPPSPCTLPENPRLNQKRCYGMVTALPGE